MTLDLSSLFHTTIGFEDRARILNNFANSEQAKTYPPYNIIRHTDDKFDIEIAVAGFKEEELNVEVKDNTITVEGTKEEKTEEGYTHRGIANRSFRRTWHLEDYTEAVGAELKDGLLRVRLEKIIPEEMKPKKININGQMRESSPAGDAQLLNEASAK